MIHDYSAHLETAPTPEAFVKLNKLAVEQAEAEALVAKLEAELDQAKARLRKVSEEDLPGLMDELQLTEFKTTNGLTIAVKEDIFASISEANESAAFKWLTDNGHGEIIKHEFKVQFGRAENDEAQAFAAAVKEMGHQASQKQSVHGSTLKKFVKDALEEGTEIPLETFGVFRRRVSKVQS